jgi:hypothetical protein
MLRAAVTGLVTSIVLVVVVGLVIVTLGLEDEVSWTVFGGAAILTLLFAVMTAAAAVARRGRLVPLMAVSVLAAAAGTALVYALLLPDEDPWSDQDEIMVQAAVGCFIVGVALVHSGVFALIPTHSRLLLSLKVVTMACPWLAMAVITGFLLLEPSITSWVIEVIVGVSSWVLVLLTVLGTILVPVGAHVGRERAAAETIGGRIRIELACPRCGMRQRVPTGTTRCGRCRAWLKVDVDEPRCECGYQLYQLRGDRCPECGRDIPADRQWPAESVAAASS